MTEHEVTGSRKSGKPIAMGSYTIDSHNVQRYVAKDEQGRAYVLNEGDLQVPLQDPYPISYDRLFPLHECSNLLCLFVYLLLMLHLDQLEWNLYL